MTTETMTITKALSELKILCAECVCYVLLTLFREFITVILIKNINHAAVLFAH